MMFPVVLLFLLFRSSHASFFGTLRIYSVKNLQENALTVMNRPKLTFSTCEETVSWFGGSTPNNMVEESSGEWCQVEFTWTWSFQFVLHQYTWSSKGISWTQNRNGVQDWQSNMYTDVRRRSDTNTPNAPPQTTIIPVLRVPSNCPRDISLLTFDLDGDEVQCRYAASSSSECVTCSAASVLQLLPSCTLSFTATDSSNEGQYAVQLMMEDFPRQTIVLTDSAGAQTTKATSDAMARNFIQFLFKVDPAVPSCTEGLYLPRFLSPTPEHRTLINAAVGQRLEIPIKAEATQAETTDLLLSGPPAIIRSASGPGSFTLTWTPSSSEEQEMFPICFIIKATVSGSVYQSELRCVIVNVGINIILPSPSPEKKKTYMKVLKLDISSPLPLNEHSEAISNLIKDELKTKGLSITNMQILSSKLKERN